MQLRLATGSMDRTKRTGEEALQPLQCVGGCKGVELPVRPGSPRCPTMHFRRRIRCHIPWHVDWKRSS